MSTRSGTYYLQTYSDQVSDPNPRRAYHEPDYEPHPRRSQYHDPEYNQWCYEQRLLDQWYRLKQGDATVSEYVARFNKYDRRCSTTESEAQIISRFRTGVRKDIQWELFQWEIHYLEDAYQIARNFETYQKELLISRSKPNRNDTSGHRLSSSQVPSNKPTPIIPVICKEEIYEPIEEPEVEIYEAAESLVDEYKGELEKESEPIEPLNEHIKKVCQDKEVDRMKMESSDQLEVIKPDQNPVTAEESDEVMSERNNIWMLTDRIHPQEVRASLDEFIGIFPDSCPEPSLPFQISSNLNLPSWGMYHAFNLVPVPFSSYVLKTLWHLLDVKCRFTTTYLKLCASLLSQLGID